MSKYKKFLGAWGENIAQIYYKNLGWQILTKNFYTRYGELDLVFIKNNKILIVEVKTRSGFLFGFAEESISKNKLQNLRTAAQIFCQKQELKSEFKIEICVVEKINKKIKILCFEV